MRNQKKKPLFVTYTVYHSANIFFGYPSLLGSWGLMGSCSMVPQRQLGLDRLTFWPVTQSFNHRAPPLTTTAPEYCNTHTLNRSHISIAKPLPLIDVCHRKSLVAPNDERVTCVLFSTHASKILFHRVGFICSSSKIRPKTIQSKAGSVSTQTLSTDG